MLEPIGADGVALSSGCAIEVGPTSTVPLAVEVHAREPSEFVEVGGVITFGYAGIGGVIPSGGSGGDAVTYL